MEPLLIYRVLKTNGFDDEFIATGYQTRGDFFIDFVDVNIAGLVISYSIRNIFSYEPIKDVSFEDAKEHYSTIGYKIDNLGNVIKKA